MNWTCLDNDRHVYAAVIGSDIVRVAFDGRPDKCCFEGAYVAARLALLEAGGHRIKELALGTIPLGGFDRIGAADQLASVRHDLTIRIEAAS